MSTLAGLFVNLGENVQFLSLPQAWDKATYEQKIRELHQYLEACGLSSTKATAQSLLHHPLPVERSTNRITPAACEQLRLLMRQVVDALSHEMKAKRLTVIQPGDVTVRLRRLPTTATLTPIQQHLLDETIRCVEVEAYRSALVMGWNLAFDYIRQWIFDKELDAFNTHLSNMYPKKTPVATYEDFFHAEPPISEYELLSVLRGPSGTCNIVRDKIIDNLVHHLRERNNYAHADFTAPSAAKANAYIEHLLDVMCAPPFT